MRSRASVERDNDAVNTLAHLQGAESELAMFKEDLRRYEPRASVATRQARCGPFKAEFS
jgi:hypothetical protein